MGEMADFALEQVVDNFGRETLNSGTIRCRCCGVTGLHWENSHNKWLLFDKNGLHKCTANPYIDK